MRREIVVRFAIFAASLTVLVLLTNCGGSSTGLIGTFPYQFKDAPTYSQPYGCDTGYKEARSREEYCLWLADDRQNIDPRTGQVCALERRKRTFEVNCVGYTWPGP